MKQTTQATLSIFDIDDTLFHTTAKVGVLKDGVKVRRLSNKEFNTYVLNEGESFDYSEFRCSHKFFSESTPIVPILQIAKQRLAKAQQCTQSRVIMVTARANFDSKEQFLETFRKHQFDIDLARVERAGNLSESVPIAVKKAIIIRDYLLSGNFTQADFYDDAIGNLQEFLGLKNQFPEVKFNAYLASETGAELLE